MRSAREIVKDALAHKVTERIPYCINFTQEGIDELKKVIPEDEIESYIDNDVAQISIPWWTWHELGEDWKGMNAPTSWATVIGTGPSYQEAFDKIHKIREEQDKYILVMVYGSHWEKAYFSRGIENFLADLAGEPEFAQKLLDLIIEKNLVMLENVLNNPEIDGVLLGSDWGTQADLIMSPDTWENMIRPGEQKEYDLVHGYGKDVWIHSCGNVVKVMDSLVEMGIDVLNPVQPECMDIRMLKESYGGQISFWGGISTQKTLPLGTPEEVKREARDVRDFMAFDGGYVLSPAQAIQGDVPAENIVALLEVAKENK